MTEPTPRIEAEARDWLVLLESGRATERDLRRFHDWQATPAHAQMFERERSLWQDLGQLAAGVQMPRPRPTGRRAFLRGGLALAAGSAVAPRLFFAMRADHASRIGGQTLVQLPDGSDALLNTDTAIAVDYEDGKRRLRLLQGEALFRVRAGQAAFVVAAGGNAVRTAGGAFALRFEDGAVGVVSEDAKLRIRIDDHGGGTVPPGHKVAWQDGAMPAAPMPSDPARDLAWREGRIVFDDTPFVTAVHELGRYLPERIILRDGGQGTVSGSFAVADAQDALRALAITQGMQIRRFPHLTIIIS